MPAQSFTEEDEQDSIIDDVSNLTVERQVENQIEKEIERQEKVKEEPKQEDVNQDKLAALRAKMQANQEPKMSAKIIARKARTLNFGVVGTGQGGSRLAEYYFSLGYEAIACNTAQQDLQYIDIPDSNKLLMQYGVGGASKDLAIGQAAAEMYSGELTNLINNKLSNSHVNILCLSLGGGSGAGSCETLVSILSQTGKPLVVMAILPMESEDAQTKSNALQTLSKLAEFTKNKVVNNCIVIDNAKIESIYSDVSQLDFYAVANKAIVDPLDALNVFSSMASSSKGLDSMEFSKILIDSEGLCVYGDFTVENYQEDTAIAEAVINNLSGNLLAAGFDLKQSKYVGYIIAANKKVWAKINSSSVNYANSMISDLCGSPKGIFKGIYTVDDMQEDVVRIISIFSGLGLPSSRVGELRESVKELQAKIKVKDEARNLTLQLDAGNETISAAQKIKDKIAAKSSSFGKFVVGTTDRRK